MPRVLYVLPFLRMEGLIGGVGGRRGGARRLPAAPVLPSAAMPADAPRDRRGRAPTGVRKLVRVGGLRGDGWLRRWTTAVSYLLRTRCRRLRIWPRKRGWSRGRW